VLRHLHVARAAFANRSYYRFELVFEVLRALAMALVLFLVWRALYADAAEIGGYTLAQMLAYTGAATLLSLVYNVDVAHDLSDRLKTGAIASDLVRPMGLGGYLFCLHLGRAAYALAFAGLPFAIALAALGAFAPDRVLAATPLAIVGFLLYYAVCHVFAIGVFFTTEAWGIEYFRINLLRFFAGGIVPLSLLPEPLLTASRSMPFELIFYAPAAVAAGTLDGVGGLLLRQLGWLAAILAFDLACWRVALRRVTIHGG